MRVGVYYHMDCFFGSLQGGRYFFLYLVLYEQRSRCKRALQGVFRDYNVRCTGRSSEKSYILSVWGVYMYSCI